MAGRKFDFCWPDREVCLNDCLLGMYTVWLGGNWTFTDLKGKYAWMIVFWTGAVHLSFSPKLGRKCTDRHPSMLLMPYENSFETTTATRIRLVLRLYSQPKHQWEGTVPQSSTFSLQPQKPAGHARQVLELTIGTQDLVASQYASLQLCLSHFTGFCWAGRGCEREGGEIVPNKWYIASVWGNSTPTSFSQMQAL